MLELIYTSNKSISVGSLNTIHMYYVRAWDALILHDWTAPNKVHKLFRDGSQAVMISSPWGSIRLTGRVSGQFAWMNISGLDDGDFWPADEISGNFHSDTRLNGTWNPNLEQYKSGNFIDDINHVAVFGYTNSRVHFINLITGLEEWPYLDLGTGSLTYNHVAWAGNGKVVVINFSSGRISLIDYLQRTIIFQSTVSACKAAAYDCIHNLIVSIGDDSKVRVYTMEVVPSTLALPSFIPSLPHQHRLVGSKVQTRLTGSIGEPCKNYWIHWDLLGNPPKGELEKDKSQTDEDGYAENYYYGPRAVGDVGSETIQASVKVP